MSLFKKLFCRHRWRTHAKEKREWVGRSPVPGTEHWSLPLFEEGPLGEVVEVLVCKRCGKIATLKY